MRGRRGRRIRAAVKLGFVFFLPAAAIGAVKAVPFLKSAADLPGSVHSGKNGDQAAYANSTLNSLSREQELRDEVILSHGYGVYQEAFDTEVRLLPPLEMTSDDPGAKPYPETWTKGVKIVRTTYGEYSGTGYFNLDGCGQVNNKTTVSNDTLLKESRLEPEVEIADLGEPQVLIYHTHTTESFEPFVRENLDGEFNYRTTDETKNMIMVGNAIQAELEAKGYGVIHVTEIHDYPSYNGSYARSRESIVPILEQYPSISVALDIHRDAVSGEDFASQPYIEVDGKEAAQIMIISGCDDGTLGMPDYMKNFRFACKLQQQLEGDYNGLTRPILFDYRHYNQDLTTGSLLIEVGSHGNTLDQAQYSGQLIGRSLCRLFDDMREDE
ncbi:MAG: stage II sporulation protein P [Ruminococcus sp.]|nr:stage II sporulation protein P [Ruminococcus sp.]